MHCIPSRIIPSSAVHPFHHECSHSSFITELSSDWNRSFSSSVQTLAMVSSAVTVLTCSSQAFPLFFGLGPLDPFAGLLLVIFSKKDFPSHVGGEVAYPFVASPRCCSSTSGRAPMVLFIFHRFHEWSLFWVLCRHPFRVPVIPASTSTCVARVVI